MTNKINYNAYTFIVFLLGNFIVAPFVLFTMISFAPPFWFYNPWWIALYFFLVILPRSCALLLLNNKFPSPPFQKIFGVVALLSPLFLIHSIVCRNKNSFKPCCGSRYMVVHTFYGPHFYLKILKI